MNVLFKPVFCFNPEWKTEEGHFDLADHQVHLMRRFMDQPVDGNTIFLDRVFYPAPDLKYNYVYKFLQSQGFAPLYRRSRKEKTTLEAPIEQAPRFITLGDKVEQFNTGNIGILCFLPLIRKYGIDQAMIRCRYPGTSQMSPLSSVLSFVAMKQSNVKRYSQDDL